MDLDTAKKFIYDWIKRETELEVIEDLQGKPRPKLPYASYRFLAPQIRVGSIDELRANGDEFSIHGLRTSTVSINIFGKDANTIMSNLVNSLDLPENVDGFAAAGIAHIGEEGPNDLSELMETKYQERSQFDLQIMFGMEKESNIGPIESVQIEGTVEGQGQIEDIVSDFEIETQ